MRKFVIAAMSAAIFVLVSAASFSAANADTLPPFDVSGSSAGVFDNLGNATSSDYSNPSPSLGGFASAGNSGATASVSASNAGPTISASVATTIEHYQAHSVMNLTYYFQVVSSIGDVSGINAIASGSYLMTGTNTNVLYGHVALDIDACTSVGCTTYSQLASLGQYGPTAGEVSYNFNLSLDSDTVYKVVMSAEAHDYGQIGSADATIDPLISLDVGDPQDFQLDFSPGISNASATPLPAALPLFAGGLGVLGLLRRRRRRKNVVSRAAA